MSSHPETRRIGSIPEHTMREVWRRQAGVSARFGNGRISLGIRGLGTGVPRRSSSGKEDFFDVHPYVPPKPDRKKPRETLILPVSERITCKIEQMDDYDGKGSLGIFLEFAGIGELTEASFLRGRRYYGPDTTLFYSPVVYQKKKVLLLLATTGDIFELQVAARKDANPIFHEELYLPHLATTHNPTSMVVQQNNGLVIVTYKST